MSVDGLVWGRIVVHNDLLECLEYADASCVGTNNHLSFRAGRRLEFKAELDDGRMDGCRGKQRQMH